MTNCNLQKHPTILKSEDAKKIIRSYNKIARILTEYEMLYYRGWIQCVEVAKHDSKAPGSVLTQTTFVLCSEWP